MKRIARRRGQEGNIILMVIVITACVSVATLAYVRLISTQNSFTVRSQTWNTCLPVVEAGIEDALGQLTTATNSNLAASGWAGTSLSFSKTNSIGEGYYVVSVNCSNLNAPIITCQGYMPAPLTLTSAAHGPLLAAFVPDPKVKYISRTVVVTLQRDQSFPKALIARSYIDFNGNNVLVDSYRSSNPLGYAPATVGDKGDVFVNGDVKNSGNVGNANIKGKVVLGPKGTFKIGPNGCIGSLAWHVSPGKGLQAGWTRRDANIALPPVQAPWTGGAVAPLGIGGGWKYVLDGGNFQLNSLSIGKSDKMRVKADSVLYVTGNIDISGEIEVTDGVKLRIYCAGAQCSLQGTYTKKDIPGEFLLYGLPSLKNITANGFAAAIYAPSAAMVLTGNNQFYGSAAVDSLTLSGSSKFHYDEDLASLPGTSYVMASWNEL